MNHPYETNLTANLHLDKRLNEAEAYRQAKKFGNQDHQNGLLSTMRKKLLESHYKRVRESAQPQTS